MSRFYSILRLRGNEDARRVAKLELQQAVPDMRLDENKRGELGVDLSREREDWSRHQEEVAASLERLAGVLCTMGGCSGVVDSAVRLSFSHIKILGIYTYRITAPVIRLLEDLGLEYELSIYLSPD